MKRSALAATLTVATLCLPSLADFPSMPPVKEGLWKIHNVDIYPDQPTRRTPTSSAAAAPMMTRSARR